MIAFPSLAANATTIHVPADQPTIQAAINAASDGDTVLVAPGTYYENINFMGKAITVTSSGGPSVTTINGGAAGPVVLFDTGEGRGSVLSGFTITNGIGGITPNTAGGGGIEIDSASPTITGNVVTNNDAGSGRGAGIFANGGSALIQGNVITKNHQGASQQGEEGGGVFIGGSGSVELIGNQISSNVGGYGGGVAVNPFSTPTIENNTITGNTANAGSVLTSTGGGIYVYDSQVVIVQNLITGNSAQQGGGVYITGLVMPTLVNNTIANNDSANGSGVYDYEYSGSQAQLFNDLIVANQGQIALYCDGSDGGIQDGLAPIVQSGDAFSSGGTGFGGNCAGMAGTNGDLSADPLFLDAASNFHLQSGSPAIDTGSNSAPNLPSIDLDGNPRTVNGTVDMGVYEFTPTTLSFAPNDLSFGSQDLGTTTSPQVVTVTNTGSQNLLLGVSVGANFTETNSCGSAVAPGANCTISVSFAPTTAGTLTGNLTLRDNASGSPQTVALSGSGIAPTAGVSPASLTFAAQEVGTTSGAQVVTLTNTGAGPLAVSSIATTGDFAENDNCGTSLAAGANCSISVTFTPTASGTRSGSLAISDDATGSPQTVALSGSGTAPTASLTPTSLTFGSQEVGTTSAAQVVTLTNGGNSSLSISGIGASGDFAETDNCGTSLAAGANCSISVTFTPVASGTRSGSLAISDNATGSPQTVALSGSGTAPTANLAPTSLSFGSQEVEKTSAAQVVTLANGGNISLSISGIAASGDFAETNNCGTSLAAGANCSISVTFAPTTTGTRSGSLTVTDNASGSPQTVALSGTGTAPTASLTPTSVSFAGQLVGTTSAAQQVTLSNSGSASLSISSIATTGDFAETNNCGTSLAAGSNCSVSVTFTPSATGTRTGSLTVTDNATGSPQTVALGGTGTTPAASLAPTSLTFGDQVVGTTSAAQATTLSNTGNATLTISGITVTSGFAQTNNCGTTLAAGAKCSISVTFTPSATGALTGTLTVSSNSPGGVVSAALSGTGAEYAPTFSPTSLVFPGQVVGTKSGGKNVKMTANGPGPLVISSISVTGEFLESNNCHPTLNQGQSCNITINFLPTVGGPASGTIAVNDNGVGSPQMIPVSGSGLDFTVSATPSAVTINAGQTAQYTVTATEVGGSFNNKVNLTCSGLPAASKCHFSPGGISPKNGSASSALSIQTTSGASGTPSGTYEVTIIGTSGHLIHTTAVTLIVN